MREPRREGPGEGGAALVGVSDSRIWEARFEEGVEPAVEEGCGGGGGGCCCCCWGMPFADEVCEFAGCDEGVGVAWVALDVAVDVGRIVTGFGGVFGSVVEVGGRVGEEDGTGPVCDERGWAPPGTSSKELGNLLSCDDIESSATNAAARTGFVSFIGSSFSVELEGGSDADERGDLDDVRGFFGSAVTSHWATRGRAVERGLGALAEPRRLLVALEGLKPAPLFQLAAAVPAIAPVPAAAPFTGLVRPV